MAKKKASASNKAAAKVAKKAKTAQKVERKEQKKKGRPEDEDDDQDLEQILDKIKREWEEAHKVTEETVGGPPSRRANATITPCPSGNHLWFIGGEFFSEDGKAHFYNDVYRYTPEKDEWRRFVSPTCPGPRSAHAVVASTSGGGMLFLFGGEFSSLYQNSFHHYRDFWCFDISTHTWERIETKLRPSARSGHRMTMWKHFIVLFGGFYDPGLRTKYLNDLWLFDTLEYKWKQVEFGPNDRTPSPRSGFSLLSTPEGIIVHGGYCKEYVKGKRVQGVALEDTWFLKMDAELKVLKWTKRKKIGYAPSIRSGCTMAYWASKTMGVLFGGVHDDDRDEETMESVFYNDLYGYLTTSDGRWLSLALKKPKKKAGAGAKIQPKKRDVAKEPAREDSESENEDDEREVASPIERPKSPPPTPVVDPDDPLLITPLVRYNAMLAVLRNTLYIYGGIYERGAREYTLDDFYALQLDKMERYTCLKPCDVVFGDGEESSSDDDSDESDGDSETHEDDVETLVDAEDGADNAEKTELDAVIEEEEPEEVIDLRAQATTFLGVAKDSTRSAEDVISTPLPGETLAMFYARSREYWAQKAHTNSDNRGKLLRRDGFALADERYATYKPLLAEVEKILAEAGLDEEEMRRGASTSALGGGTINRNRR